MSNSDLAGLSAQLNAMSASTEQLLVIIADLREVTIERLDSLKDELDDSKRQAQQVSLLIARLVEETVITELRDQEPAKDA